MSTRSKRKALVDANIDGDLPVGDKKAIMNMIESIERQVEERVQEIVVATQDAVSSLHTALQTKLLRLPKSVKGMKVRDVFGSGDRTIDATEPRGTADMESPMQKRQKRETSIGKDGGERSIEDVGDYYNGKPLQTPMPFAGKAIPMPVTMLTVQQQGKRAGGKTKASRDEPRAAIVTTKDGKQWAIGSKGLQDIPESHRQEVATMLSAQFAFLRDALHSSGV